MRYPLVAVTSRPSAPVSPTRWAASAKSTIACSISAFDIIVRVLLYPNPRSKPGEEDLASWASGNKLEYVV